MRIQTIRYIFKEGFLYFFRNKLMGIASCAIITAALIILGVFALLLINIDSNLKALGEKPQIRIYCRHDLGDAEVFALEDEIRAEPGIREFEFIAKDAAFVRAKEIL
ncbi:MAG: permease-like cell division protein FtsX, partial [Clostridiales bacterium]|nr:permease-like cell division protein FtsX [Clostridiales bacterium]